MSINTGNSSARTRNAAWPELGLIGAYPPPYGGIGVHLQRVTERLEQAGADFILYNTVSPAERRPTVRSVAHRRGLWFLWFCLRHRCRIAHLVTTNWSSHLLFGLTARLRAGVYVLSIHNMLTNDALHSSNFLRARLTRWFLRQMHVVVACNPEIARACRETAHVPPERIRIIPAFIPPANTQALPLPEGMQAFAQAHQPLLSTVAWVRHYQGADLYGTDLMIELIDRLRRDYPRIGLIIKTLGVETAALEQTVAYARQRLGHHILVCTETLDDISGLLQRSDVFLRATNTDGDANSIREALWLGSPVVASDVVPRPEGCVLFRTRNLEDLERQVRAVLGDLPGARARVAASARVDNAIALLQLYDELRG
jgi:glycosyltransferase involved in cell wall biosynthesis